MGILKRFESLVSAAAFAEEGEFETARMIVLEDASPVASAKPDALGNDRDLGMTLPPLEA